MSKEAWTISEMVRDAKSCRRTARTWKRSGFNAAMVNREIGEARGMMRAARLVKGFATQARHQNRFGKKAA